MGGITGSISHTVMLLDAGIAGEGAGGNTGAEADARAPTRVGMSKPGRCPTMRCSFISNGSVVASTWPLTSISVAPSFQREMATEELRPSAA